MTTNDFFFGVALFGFVWVFALAVRALDRFADEFRSLKDLVQHDRREQDLDAPEGNICAACTLEFCALCGEAFHPEVPVAELDGFTICAEHLETDDPDEDELDDGEPPPARTEPEEPKLLQ